MGASSGEWANERSVKYGCSCTRSQSVRPKGPGFSQIGLRHGDSADVERERGASHHRNLGLRETETPGGRLGELGGPLGVSAQPVGLEVGERPDHAECGIDLVTGDPALGRRLGGDRLLPDQRVVESVEQLSEVIDREGGQTRVVGAAGALLDPRA